ncbi:hypothetical protein F8M41_025524 [Gigaspora margarita]|uniref:Zn(2)-C6 fungal-type domain-containing protein n=1 Tax=Gigaspora margarita TaxID=4874 RepID=A0A8H4A9T0_GIGMA|nr:hypothetical protein F8M41_025524 [Gigaspora margarita]
MPQLNKPRANAVLACTNCRKSHRRCERPSKNDICTYCRNRKLPCINALGRKHGPRSKSSNFLYETATEEFQPSNSNLEPLLTTEAFIVQEPSPNNQNTMLIDSYETTNEEFQSPYLNFGIPHTYNLITTISSHIYNHITIIPSFRTDEVFIGQRLMSDNQNTTSINSYEITAFINRALIPNTASLNPYEITIEEFKSSFSNFGSPYIYNHITVIPPFEATETFFGQGPMLYQNTTPIVLAKLPLKNSNSPLQKQLLILMKRLTNPPIRTLEPHKFIIISQLFLFSKLLRCSLAKDQC